MKDNVLQYLKPLAAIAIIAFMVWYFSDIVTYILVATFLSLLGMPMARKLNLIRIGRFRIPKAVSALLTLLSMVLIFILFILVIVPLIIKQGNVIATIDIDALLFYYQKPMNQLNEFLVQYNVIGSGETLAQYFESQLNDFLNFSEFTNFFANIVTATGTVFMGTFIILFLTFYFLMDDNLGRKFILTLTPEEHVENMDRILSDSKSLLTRYFHGILIEVVIMMTIESTGLLIFGVPNAVLIGFFGGLMNVIPYLGPIIGASLGVALATLSELSLGNYDMVPVTIITVIGVFAFANVIDNTILQPQIYSRSTKAHPVEVFLVIIVGGKLAGIAGMILAIPTYTVVKIIAREFAQRMKLVKFLTGKM
jgi:predicted PurR-regulated permease PerM